MRSDSRPQNSLPTPLHNELIAMSVAPYSASVAGSRDGSESPQTSCSNSDWKLITVMPAAMLKKNTIHMNTNCWDPR